MPMLTVQEKTFGGGDKGRFQLKLPEGKMLVRDLIRKCVDFQVAAYTQSSAFEQPTTLFVPTDEERALHGDKSKTRLQLDIQKQYERSFKALESNQILLLVDGHQFDNLGDEIMICPDSSVTFLKLVPLVGG